MKTNQLTGLLLLAATLVQRPAAGQVALQPGQVNPFLQTMHIEELLEKTSETLETEYDVSALAEELSDLAAKPVNLNTAKEDELNSIPFLSQAHRTELQNYIQTYGDVLSFYELLAVPGFDSSLIVKIQPYISISPISRVPRPTPGNLLKFGRHDLLLRYGQAFPKPAGYVTDDSLQAGNSGPFYPGTPQKYYYRYTWSWFDKIKIGFAGEKDPGEQFFKGAQSSGMDFYAAYLSLNQIGFLKNLTIGNFRVSYGQGLTVGSGLSLGSVPGFSTNITIANGIRPNLGMNEGSYLRGLAATIKIKRIEASGFASYHARDATVSLTGSNSSIAEEVSSLNVTGYHRTESELEKRNALTELVCGANINFSMAPTQQFGFKAGATGLFYRYSAKVNPAVFPYNRFIFRGSQNVNTGFDLQVRYRGMYFFGEVAGGHQSGTAWLAGATLMPDQRVCLTLIYRNYPSNYQNLFANAFGQNSLNANEKGLYVGVNAAVHPVISLSGYTDLFTFPWLKYRVDAPSRGRESGIILSWQATRSVLISLRMYQKNARTNGTTAPEQIMHKLNDYITRNYRFSMEWPAGKFFLLKTRIEVKQAGMAAMKRPYGCLAYQEVQMRSQIWLEALTLRFALFDIPAYESRIYMYEPEVLYGYSVPAYQGRGMRTCLVLKLGVSGHADLWVRGGITYYTDRQEAGSGPDLTEGNVRGEVTGQLLIRF